MRKISNNQCMVKNNIKKRILLAHGAGGTLMHELIHGLFKKYFSNEILDELSDSAIIRGIPVDRVHLCFTTDSYTVDPVFFPGGDIGKLAVCGTVNDIAVMGARPLYLSAGFIIEEGLEYSALEKITRSMARAARDVNVKIVTGDVKVVERNSADKLFINTSGIGIRDDRINFSREDIKPGDKIIINGPVGEHGMAVLAARGEFGFQAKINSDCACLTGLIQRIVKLHLAESNYSSACKIKFMRDPTRGGLATTLNEIVDGMNFGILLNEKDIHIKEEVKAACELLGFDPLYIANEGKVLVIASEKGAEILLKEMRRDPLGKDSMIIGEVVKSPVGRVHMKTRISGNRIIDMLTGEQFPRIC